MSRELSRASLFLASGTLVSRALGFSRTVVSASVIGLVGSAGADAFAVANQLPNTIYAIVAGGVLSAVLVPHIVAASAPGGGGERFINKLLTLSLSVLFLTTLVATLAAGGLARLYGATLAPATLDLATSFAWWCLPQVFFYGAYSLLGEVLNARRVFGPFTWSPVVNNVVALAGLGLFALAFGADGGGNLSAGAWTEPMVMILAGSATLGVAAQAAVLLAFWRRTGLSFRLDFGWRGVGLGRAGRAAGWSFGMLALSTVAGLVETVVAGIASNTPGAASVAALSYAWLIFMLPHSIVTVSIGTAYFTRMSEHASAGRITDVLADLRGSLRAVILAMGFSTLAVTVFAGPLAAVFQPHNENGGVQALSWFALITVAFVVGLVPFSALFLIQRVFYALHDTRAPFGYTLVQVAVFSGLALGCAALPAQWIAVGIAASMSVAGLVQLAVATVMLRRRVGPLGWRDLGGTVARFAVAGGASLVVAVPVMLWLGGAPWAPGFALESRAGALTALSVGGGLMLGVFIVVLRGLRAPELGQLQGSGFRRHNPE